MVEPNAERCAVWANSNVCVCCTMHMHTDNTNAYDYAERWRGKWWLKCLGMAEMVCVLVALTASRWSSLVCMHALQGLNMCFSYVNVLVYRVRCTSVCTHGTQWYNARKSVTEFRHFLPFQCKYVITIMACRYGSTRRSVVCASCIVYRVPCSVHCALQQIDDLFIYNISADNMSTSTHSSTEPSRIGKLRFGPCNALEILCSKNPNIISRFDLLWKAIYTSSSIFLTLSLFRSHTKQKRPSVVFGNCNEQFIYQKTERQIS